MPALRADRMSFFRDNWLLILVAFLSGAMLLWPFVQRRFSPMKELGTLGVTHLVNQQEALLLDVRETKDYEGGRIPNAVHVPLSQLESRAGELGKYAGRPVIAYCATGARSRTAGATLAKAGFKDVYNLNGGFRAWKDAGLPVEKEAR
ncbi:MAG TPA: rhodanese-like domain-containing protein [Casimicrobiaceae bacterium]|nr:rhodanese-like domain-containing protein [Casimicrobiaceae bacterium]